MNKPSKQKDLIFAVLVGFILAGAMWFTVGQWVIYSICQSTPTAQCVDQATNATMAVAIVIGLLIAAFNVRGIVKNQA